MPQSFVCLYCHLIFSTKNRVPLIGEELRPRLHEYFGGILKSNGCDPMVVGGTADHLHALYRLGKQVTPCASVRLSKTASSRWVHETFAHLHEFGWQNGYSLYPVSAKGVELAKAYIRNQEEHHRTMTFQEEYLKFLRAHGEKWDDRYVWD